MHPTRSRRTRIAGTLLPLLLLISPFSESLQAHDYWILPDRFHLDQSGWIAFDYTAAHDYFGSEENPLHQHLDLVVVSPSGKVDSPALYSGRLRAVGEAHLAETGTHLLLSKSLSPLFYTQFDDATGAYVSRDRTPPGKTAVRTGRYIKSVKTYVTVGTPDRALLQPQSADIEIIPQNHPSEAATGRVFALSVLYQGKPLAGTEVTAVPEGFAPDAHGAGAMKVKADAQGIAPLTFPSSGITILR